MSRRDRYAPVLLMGVLAVMYVALHRWIVAHVPYVTILEFPIGAAVFGFLLWAALGRRGPVPVQPWRRHRQVVRLLPDPAIEPYERTLERWIDTGASPDAAAGVLARSSTTDVDEQARIQATLAAELASLTMRRQRESYLKNQLRQGV